MRYHIAALGLMALTVDALPCSQSLPVHTTTVPASFTAPAASSVSKPLVVGTPTPYHPVLSTPASASASASASKHAVASSATAPAASIPSLVTERIVQAVAGLSISCATGGNYASQCRTAAQVAPVLSEVFARYGTTSPGEMAALVSLMALESAEFKYNVNVFPGRPGQGTYNMQMPHFNYLYASAIPALRPQTAAIANGAVDSSFSDDQKNKIVGLLNAVDEYSLGSAAWFLTTQCAPSIREHLKKDNDVAAWTNYITACVGTTVTEERKHYWNKAVAAFGVGGK